MKYLYLITLLLYSYTSCSQMKDSIPEVIIKAGPYKPEILSSGFLDLVNNGQINASARFIRISIGEPGKFSIPLSVYSGISANNFQNQIVPGGYYSNEHLVNNLINPLSGLVNISFEGMIFFDNDSLAMTKNGLIYHSGARILTGYPPVNPFDPIISKPLNFLNFFATGGIYFQTGAWERTEKENMGVFWIAGRYILCKSGIHDLRTMFPNTASNGIYHGWSVAWGLDIKRLVNLKIIYYNYLKAPEPDFAQPIYQFSFQYSLR